MKVQRWLNLGEGLKSLADYGPGEYPTLINRILMEKDKIYALIPESDSASFSGQCEICDTGFVISALETVSGQGPHKVALQRFRSSDGRKHDCSDPVSVPFSRIVVERIPDEKPVPGYAIPTREFAAVMDVWRKYAQDGELAVPKIALVKELEQQGFTPNSAKAIDRICRGKEDKGGRKPKK
jgi:hypothetical protein